MPGQDGTGPTGQGALTGRGLGPCGAGKRLGRGFGRGLGRSFGRRCWCPMVQQTTEVNMSEKDEKKILEAELKEIEAEKAEIAKRLKEIK
jgi:hypothetical protein